MMMPMKSKTQMRKKKERKKWVLRKERRRKENKRRERKRKGGKEMKMNGLYNFTYPKKGIKLLITQITLIIKYRSLHSSLLIKIHPRIYNKEKG